MAYIQTWMIGVGHMPNHWCWKQEFWLQGMRLLGVGVGVGVGVGLGVGVGVAAAKKSKHVVTNVSYFILSFHGHANYLDHPLQQPASIVASPP